MNIRSKPLTILMLYLLSVSYTISYFDVAFENPMISSVKWIFLFLTVCLFILLLRIKKPTINYSYDNLSIISFIIAVSFLNILFSVGKLTSIATLSVIVLAFVFFMLLSTIITRGILTIFEINKIIYISIFVVILFSTIISFQEYLNFINVFTGDGRYRVKGLFRHPNSMAMTCFLGAIVLFENLRKMREKKLKIHFLNYFILIFFVFNILISDSKTALFTLIAFFLIYHLVSRMRENLSYFKVIQLYFMFILFSISIYQFFSLIINTTLGDQSNSVSVRLDSWIIVFSKLFEDKVRFFFGYGLSGTGGYVNGSQQNLGLAVDNGFVTLFYQTGIIGLALVLLFLLLISLQIIMRANINMEKQYRVFTFSCILSLLMYSMFENLLFSMGNFITLYLWFRIYNYTYQKRKLRFGLNS
ncbi:oligosaccharide repeat unit polymerase [Domibacillus enclensis]|uniref:O-antigen ligase n=1 Tax=Domibacillus enclensis TaxID=1017273 RepID=A0A1N6RPX6_9BACI|nr:oligosaccharide repeat unit polymerase [Domibacillus enclensis]OXS79116.1 hypothetical protein B1B05_04880 [Domibacillus enclensis]SIQ30855.1 hypothetical protein SAMN05443094_102187 [Domibacillus enclensis]